MNKKRAIAIAIVVLIFGAIVVWKSGRGNPRIQVSGEPLIMAEVYLSGNASSKDLTEIRRVALGDARKQSFHNLYQSKGKSLGYILKSYFDPGFCLIRYQSDQMVFVRFSDTTNWPSSWRANRQNSWWYGYEIKGANGWCSF